ncbi:MAG: PPC domain-containing DNA-binding protein [Armatimonadota bacterium]
MEYTQGSMGRVFVARLYEGESIYAAVEEIARREKVAAGAVLAVGGMRSGKVVTGPEQTTGPLVPHYEEFHDAREIVGVGTLFLRDNEPTLHFHAGIGRGQSALVGCPRAGMTVYLVLEVIIIEFTGVAAAREIDAETGLHLLKILGR